MMTSVHTVVMGWAIWSTHKLADAEPPSVINEPTKRLLPDRRRPPVAAVVNGEIWRVSS